MATSEAPPAPEVVTPTPNPTALLGKIPGFRTPAARRLDPLMTETPADPDVAGDDGFPAPSDPRPKPVPDTRTATSSAGRPTERVTAELVIGLLGLAVAAAAFMVRLRSRRARKLREPTQEQYDDVGRPVARILLRHVPAGLLNPDLADALIAGAGIGRYLNDGALVVYDAPDPGVPDNLQESQP